MKKRISIVLPETARGGELSEASIRLWNASIKQSKSAWAHALGMNKYIES
jgi:hypothetical protein